MDLDKIKIISASLLALYESKALIPADENTLTLESNAKNNVSAEVLVAYRREGMNLIEDIQLGKVLDHKIIVKNSKGEDLAREPLEFDNIKAIEFFSQTLELDSRKIPAVGEYVTIHLEITYVAPYVDIACETSNDYCNKIRSLTNAANQGQLHSGKQITKEQLESNKNSIQGRITSINQELSPLLTKSSGTNVNLTPPMNLGDINVIHYREWKLVTTPTHFKISAILKNGKPADETKAEVFELPELPTALEAEKEKEKDRTFEIEKKIPPLKETPTKRRKKTIYLP
jgi:hypothetical protein